MDTIEKNLDAVTNNLPTRAYVTNPGFIATRPMKQELTQHSKKVGLNIGFKRVEAVALEVIVGNGENLAPGTLKISKGDTVYVKADRYHQTWASEVMTAKGIEEVVDGKQVPIEFILVPIAEVILVTSSMAAPMIDYSKLYSWPWPFTYPPYYIGDPPVSAYPFSYPPFTIWCGNNGGGGDTGENPVVDQQTSFPPLEKKY